MGFADLQGWRCHHRSGPCHRAAPRSQGKIFSIYLMGISLVATGVHCLLVCLPSRSARLHRSIAPHEHWPISLQFPLLLSAPSLPSFRVFFLPLGFSQVFGGLGYPSVAQKRRQQASGSLQLERRLCFVLGKKSGEPSRLFPIASPWQQAFQTHAHRQTGRGGREHRGPSARAPNLHSWGSLC